MKVTTPNKKDKGAKSAKPESVSMEAEPMEASSSAEETAGNEAAGSEEAEEVKAVEEVSIKKDKGATAEVKAKRPTVEMVKVGMLRDVDPAPTVGDYDCRRELGVRKLTKQQSYHVPRAVADALLDARAAMVAD